MADAIQYGQYAIPPAEECVAFGVGQVCGIYPRPLFGWRAPTVLKHIVTHTPVQPAPSLLPLDLVRRAAASKFAETDPLLLQVRCTGSVD
jgi:hypothetical protein